MGFEDAIPPVPTREQEIAYIARQEKNFLDQPLYKFYMNEALRTRKMKHASELNHKRLDTLMRFSLGYMLTGIVMFRPIIWFYQREAGVPLNYKPKGGSMEQGYLKYRNRKISLTWVVVSAIGGFFFANRYKTTGAFDEYMNNQGVIIDQF